MKHLLLTALGCAALMASAQQVTVTQSSRLLQGVEGPAYHPVLNGDGSRLLFTGTDGSGLKMYDFALDVTTRISDAAGAGMDAFFGGDGKVYYVTQTRNEHNLIYRTGHAYDPATAQSSVVLEAQHGAMRPMQGTTGAGLKAPARDFATSQLGTAVCTQGSEVIVTVNGRERRFSPVESHAGYLWASLSPDGQHVAFFAAGRGVVVMDLNGRVEAELGNYEMPSWYDDHYIVAQNATDDGHQFTSSQIVLLKADGTFKTELTRPTSMTMQPTAAAGKIIYTSIDGNLYLTTIAINE